MLEVPEWSNKDTSEKVGKEFFRCYPFDAILEALDADNVYTDTYNGGNGNTYSLVCTDNLGTYSDSTGLGGINLKLKLTFATILIALVSQIY